MAQIEVLFVCMGNICRSPTGEGIFKHYVESHGLADMILIDSAGTIGYHAGRPADRRMQRAALKRGYRLDSIARQVIAEDLHRFDLVIAMDEENLRDLESLASGPKDHIRLLGTFLPGALQNGAVLSVPDPYYGGDQGFEQVLDMIEQACPALLAHCEALLS